MPVLCLCCACAVPVLCLPLRLLTCTLFIAGFNNIFYWGMQMYAAGVIGRYFDNQVQDRAEKATKVCAASCSLSLPPPPPPPPAAAADLATF